MQKRSLTTYVGAVIVVLMVVDLFALFAGKIVGFMDFSLGMLVGMLAMYIAVHVYKWK